MLDVEFDRARGRERGMAMALRSLKLGAAVLISLSLLGALSYAQTYPTDEWPRTDFSKRAVDMSEIMSGGPPKDGIPAIDQPKFTPSEQADRWLDPREPVIVVQWQGTAKAYPLQILMWHEIVNDTIAQQPIAVTFCPLCNASIVFDRQVGDQVLDFGTTGRLRKSDMVMYDRQTESWWQQFSGRGIIGDFVGHRLARIPAQIVAFEDFKRSYPTGSVLSRETGFRRDYGRNPYRGYDSIDDRPFLFSDPVDKRLPPMERVLNISIGNVHKLYRFSTLENRPVINDVVSGTPVVVFARNGTLSPLDQGLISGSKTIPSANAYHRRIDNRTLTFELRDKQIVDQQTGSTWDLLGHAIAGPLTGNRLAAAPGGVHFAFAWLAFNPKSEIFEP